MWFLFDRPPLPSLVAYTAIVLRDLCLCRNRRHATLENSEGGSAAKLEEVEAELKITKASLSDVEASAVVSHELTGTGYS